MWLIDGFVFRFLVTFHTHYSPSDDFEVYDSDLCCRELECAVVVINCDAFFCNIQLFMAVIAADEYTARCCLMKG